MRSIASSLLATLLLTGLVAVPAASAQLADPCSPDRPIPYWWHTSPMQPSNGERVSLVFGSCAECVHLIGYERPAGGSLRINARMPAVCPEVTVCTPESIRVPLGRLASGHYTLLVEINAGVAQGDSGYCTVSRRETLAFTVGSPPPPPPPGTDLPWTTTIDIGSPGACDLCPPVICPGQEFPVTLAGDFMTNCLRLDSVQVLPPMEMEADPRPHPPTIVIRVATNDCMGWPCDQGPNPWSRTVMVPWPGLAPGPYRMPLRMQVVSMCDSTTVDTTYATARAFAVLDSCPGAPPPGPACLLADWDHSMRDGEGSCDAFVGPGQPARVAMLVLSGVPLAGLQGRLRTYPPGLRIAGLEPLGPAQGMRLAWQPTGDGATFVMFADQGAPIPGGVRCGPDDRCDFPVLGLTLFSDEGVPLAPVTYITAGELLGADSLGAAVPECPIQTFVMVSAQICAGPNCDFNLDGRLDVRDLVTMVHCVLGSGPCPDSSRARLDCNQDGRLNVDDVLCCAPKILRGGAPDTIPGRPEPGVAVSVNPGAWTADGVDVPVSLAAASKVGAARIALSFPTDRYDVSSVDLGRFASGWLEVHEVIDGRLVLGLIALAPVAVRLDDSGGSDLQVLVRLTPKPGLPAGGSIAVVDAQFAGPDGAALTVPTEPMTVPLPDGGLVVLRPPQPNPFVQETRLSLDLERGGHVELTVHDLGGRLIATLHRGSLAAGPHEFVWRGVRGDGSTAPNGIYFIRAVSAGDRLTCKVLLLHGD
jgi:hypothetical protein